MIHSRMGKPLSYREPAVLGKDGINSPAKRTEYGSSFRCRALRGPDMDPLCQHGTYDDKYVQTHDMI